MEINDYPHSPLKLNRTKHSRLQKAAASEYEASQVKSQLIKPQGHEQKSVQINKNEHTIIKGEIIDLRYQEVKLRMEPSGQVVTARLSGEVPLSIGQTAEFAVSKENDGQITLRYISTDNAPMNDIIHKALYASGLAPTDRNLAIVKELLSFQMPVDKHTILQLIKLTATYPEINLTTLVLMHKNNLPISISNIAQFESYQMGMHKIMYQLNDLIDNINSVLGDEVSIIDNSDLFNTPSASSAMQENISGTQINNNVFSDDIIDNNNDKSIDVMNATDGGIAMLDLSNGDDYFPSKDYIYLFNELLTILKDGENTPDHIALDTTIRDILSDVELRQLQDTILDKATETSLYNSTTIESIKNQLSSGSMTLESLLAIVHDLYNNEGSQSISENNMLPAPILEAFVGVSDYLSDTDKDKLIYLIKDNIYKDYITELLHQRWTLSPEELAQDNKVKEFFKRLDDDMEQLSKLTMNSEQFDSQNFKTSINKLQDNLQFMKDLNELFLYLQLPMRLTKQDVHGDLYVFTRKNQKHSDTDKLNVLLHLDMENLGSTDIHLSMKNRQVNAIFYLEQSSEPIVATHLNELTNALSDKGYQFQATTRISDNKPDFIIDILQQNTPTADTHRYSFDIRA